MKTIIKRWENHAQADLDAAERLFNSKRPTRWTYLLVLWHCHQTIEKGLKMIIIKKGKEIFKIHDLPRLAQLAELKLKEKDKTLLEDLNTFYLRSRYPDMQYSNLPQPNQSFTFEYLKQTKKFLLWLKQQ